MKSNRVLHHSPQDPGLRSQVFPAFTTIELLVSMAVMVVAFASVVSIFNISSGATAKTAAHAELIEASTALQGELTHQLEHIVPGLLIIESPPPTTLRAEMPGGTQWLRLRHDRLVFIAAGTANEFQSFTDPNRGIPITAEAAEPAATTEALEYFGPGVPVLADGTIRYIDGASPDLTLAASEWTLAHRSILLMQNQTEPGTHPTNWDPGLLGISTVFFSNPTGMLRGGPLDDRFYRAKADLLFAEAARSSAQTIIDDVRNRPFAEFQSLWQANLTPVTASVIDAVADQDYYTRSGFTFLPHFADFRIEWTDGRRVDPYGPDGIAPGAPGDGNDNNTQTRWFGLAPQPNGSPVPDPSNPVGTVDTMQYQARMRAVPNAINPSNPNPANPDNNPAETAAFANIEYGYNGTGSIGVTPDVDAGYRAVWRIDNWNYRPRALRFTYRIYDAGRRITSATTTDLNENGIADPDDSAIPRTIPPAIVKRFGQEFSIVVPLP